MSHRSRITEHPRALDFFPINIPKMGGRLNISPVTVKWHLGNAFQKLGVHSRTAALAKLAGRGATAA